MTKTDTKTAPAHTPTPWIWANYVNEDGTPITSKEQIKAVICASIDKGEGLFLAGVGGQDEHGECVVCYTGNGPRSHENAALIVRAVNTHDDSVEAMRKALEGVREGIDRDDIAQVLVDAIAKAEGR